MFNYGRILFVEFTGDFVWVRDIFPLELDGLVVAGFNAGAVEVLDELEQLFGVCFPVNVFHSGAPFFFLVLFDNILYLSVQLVEKRGVWVILADNVSFLYFLDSFRGNFWEYVFNPSRRNGGLGLFVNNFPENLLARVNI